RNLLRTRPRNFTEIAGTKEDRVWLCRSESATASVMFGKITDPIRLEIYYQRNDEPEDWLINDKMFIKPTETQELVELIRGPNIKEISFFDPLPNLLELPILLKVGDNISTDEILRGGSEVLP